MKSRFLFLRGPLPLLLTFFFIQSIIADDAVVEQRTQDINDLPTATLSQKLKKSLLEWGLEEAKLFEKQGMIGQAKNCRDDIDVLLNKELVLDLSRDNSLFHTIREPNTEKNPILNNIYKLVEKELKADTQFVKGIYQPRKNNTWYYAIHADTLKNLSWAFCHPQSKYYLNPDLLKLIMRRFSLAFEWWTENKEIEVKIGEKILVLNPTLDQADFVQPCMAFYRFMNTAPSLFLPSRYNDWMTAVKSKAEAHYNNTGKRLMRNLNAQAADYDSQIFIIPNKDIHIIVGLELCSKITGDVRYHEAAHAGFQFFSKFCYQDGGMSYINYENNCFSYQGINVMSTYEYYRLTGSVLAKELLNKFRTYYPLSMEPGGEAEYYTDTFAKHYWSGRGSAMIATELLAHYHSCNQNKMLAVSLGAEKKLSSPMVAELYSPDLKPGVAEDNYILYDHNIQGFRGRFGNWSYAATGRDFDPYREIRRSKDTFMGAMLLDPPSKDRKKRPLDAALAATSIYVRKQDSNTGLVEKDAFLLSSHEKNSSLISHGFATFSTSFTTLDFEHNWEMKVAPYHVKQMFLFLENTIVGYLSINGWQEILPGPVEGELRLYDGRKRGNIKSGAKHSLSLLENFQYAFGKMNIDVLEHDFESITIEDSRLSQFGKIGSSESMIFRANDPSKKSYSYAFAAYPAGKKEEGAFEVIKEEKIVIMKYETSEKVYHLIMNQGDIDVEYSFDTKNKDLYYYVYEGNGLNTTVREADRASELHLMIPAHKHLTVVGQDKTFSVEDHNIKTSAILFQ